jgi:GrpB-like predicted nucleotidyltransferase (UPF0157 family)
MTDYREAPNSRVFLSEYDEEWVTAFDVERSLVAGALGGLARRIEHIGSTAVPGIAAKPIIDVLVTVQNLALAPRVVEPLSRVGYTYVPEFEQDTPNRRYFRKELDPAHGYHLHMYAEDDDDVEQHVLFRDYLRANPDTAKEYEELKRRLAATTVRAAYTDSKAPFIKGVIAAARAQR